MRQISRLLLAAAFLAISMSTSSLWAQTYAELVAARKEMVEKVIIGSGIKNPRVIKSLGDTPRHEFVQKKFWPRAYFDMALPIGEQQTISSPFIVSYMTESVEPKATDKVLEIGTGSGYQAAVLSPLVKHVYSIEIVKELGENAARVLRRLKYKNVTTKVGDGYKGWAEYAPFDKIIVTCSPERVPKPLVDQLADGGLMVVPVGERYQQTLYLFRKKNGKLEAEALRPTLFVPMTGAAESGRRVKPDPKNPKAINGDFEQTPDESGHVPGWYYQRQAKWVTDDQAPEGSHYITFKNKEPGRVSRALQGFGIDGRYVSEITLSARVRYKEVRLGNERHEVPAVAVTLYDSQRRTLGQSWLGPWVGTNDWITEKKVIRVPPETREGILRIGLFGGVGEISMDEVKMVPRKIQPK